MKMMKHRDHTVIFGSAKLNLSREIVRKEAAVFEKAISAAMARLEDGKVQLAGDKTGRSLNGLTHDDAHRQFRRRRPRHNPQLVILWTPENSMSPN